MAAINAAGLVVWKSQGFRIVMHTFSVWWCGSASLLLELSYSSGKLFEREAPEVLLGGSETYISARAEDLCPSRKSRTNHGLLYLVYSQQNLYKDMSKGKTKFLPKVKCLPFITSFAVAVVLIWLPGDFLCMNIIFLQGKLMVFIIPSPWIHKTLQNLSCSYWYFSFLKLFFSLIISRDLIKQEEAIWRINNWLAANDASVW